MYFRNIPDHKSPAFDEQAHFRLFKEHNIVFNARTSKSHCVDHVGCLSIKTILSGEEWYDVEGHESVIRPGQFLILNDGQDYRCRVDATGEVRMQSVFFNPAFASAVFRDALAGESALLNEPFEGWHRPLEFFQTLNNTSPALEQKMTGLMAVLDRNGDDSNIVDEYLIFLLHYLIGVHKSETVRVDRVNATKPATRKEIYKRLCIARDLLHSSYMEKLDLSHIGLAACLSSPQLVRQFKAVFHTTPHQYLTHIRLEHAANLLKATSTPVHEITWRCGFEDASAFCRIFKITYGLSPLRYRAEKG